MAWLDCASGFAQVSICAQSRRSYAPSSRSRPLDLHHSAGRPLQALLQELGGKVSEMAGSRVAVVLFGEVRVFHRPHPSPNTDKGAIASIRKWLEGHLEKSAIERIRSQAGADAGKSLKCCILLQLYFIEVP
jgi:hypothetical protein